MIRVSGSLPGTCGISLVTPHSTVFRTVPRACLGTNYIYLSPQKVNIDSGFDTRVSQSKYTKDSFTFLKVLGKGSFGKVGSELFLIIYYFSSFFKSVS